MKIESTFHEAEGTRTLQTEDGPQKEEDDLVKCKAMMGPERERIGRRMRRGRERIGRRTCWRYLDCRFLFLPLRTCLWLSSAPAEAMLSSLHEEGRTEGFRVPMNNEQIELSAMRLLLSVRQSQLESSTQVLYPCVRQRTSVCNRNLRSLAYYWGVTLFVGAPNSHNLYILFLVHNQVYGIWW